MWEQDLQVDCSLLNGWISVCDEQFKGRPTMSKNNDNVKLINRKIHSDQ